jgi:hypothetical protein
MEVSWSRDSSAGDQNTKSRPVKCEVSVKAPQNGDIHSGGEIPTRMPFPPRICRRNPEEGPARFGPIDRQHLRRRDRYGFSPNPFAA